jgi:hypothetical protein
MKKYLTVKFFSFELQEFELWKKYDMEKVRVFSGNMISLWVMEKFLLQTFRLRKLDRIVT